MRLAKLSVLHEIVVEETPTPRQGGHSLSTNLPVPPRNAALEAWTVAEDLTNAERIDRLAADRDLIEGFTAAGFAGADWDFFENELARYGLAVIRAWLRRGLMRQKCAEKRIPAVDLPAGARGDEMAIQSLAGETVADAIRRFRDEVLIPGVWDPDKGASLRTFFIGQCLRRYPNAHQQWARHELPQGADHPEVELDAVASLGRVRGVEDDAIRSYTASLMLRDASSERAARCLVMDACGYSNASIAADLGMTVDAVSSLLKRERARLRDRHASEGTGSA